MTLCECECACEDRNRRHKHRPCARCQWLDGKGRTGRCISELRSMGGSATNDALALELGISRTGVIKAIRPLVLSGRVLARVYDVGHDHDVRAATIYELRL